MQWKNSPERYGIVAKSFHWVMALLIFGMLAAGYAMQHVLTRQQAAPVYDVHKSFGVVVLLLVVLRWTWRMMNAVPPVPGHLPSAMRAVARTTHWGLYALMVVTPILGILMSQASPYGVNVFGWFELPRIVGQNHELHETLEDWHAYAAYTMLGLISLHVGAALFHRFYYRDEILARMMPGGKAA